MTKALPTTTSPPPLIIADDDNVEEEEVLRLDDVCQHRITIISSTAKAIICIKTCIVEAACVVVDVANNNRPSDATVVNFIVICIHRAPSAVSMQQVDLQLLHVVTREVSKGAKALTYKVVYSGFLLVE